MAEEDVCVLLQLQQAVRLKVPDMVDGAHGAVRVGHTLVVASPVVTL